MGVTHGQGPHRRVPVLIVGGGPCGLALAGELGWQGIECILIEQGDGVVRTPKLTEVNIRTMELCRRWGIDREVRDCPFPGDYPLDVVFLQDLARDEIARIARPARDIAASDPDSPMRFQACSQMWFDPILQAFARRQPGVSLRYHKRLEALRQRADGVEADVIDSVTGQRELIEADYLAACDGAGSSIRRALGIGLDGGVLGHTVHMHFRAPGLLDAFGKRPATFFHLIDRGGLWATLRVIDPASALWRVMVLHVDDEAAARTLDRDETLRRVFGRRFEIEWLDGYVWTRRSMVAQRYRADRVFLVGDSAHQFSPTGALGMNTGIADAVDLGWKLAATLEGWGGHGLLASYEVERRPVAERNAHMTAEFYLEYKKFDTDIDAIERSPASERPGGWQRLAQRLVRDVGRNFRTKGLQIGYRYQRSPICVDDEIPAPPDAPDGYRPTTSPGARAPHAWLPDGRSTLDLFARGFVLLCLGEGGVDTSRLEAAAAERGVPLTRVRVSVPEVFRAYGRRLVLVRPDGHVAWRGDAVPADAARIVDRLRGATLCSPR